MLAETARAPFSRDGWLFELKYDGYRLLAGVTDGAARLLTRRGTDATSDYPAIAAAVAALGHDCVLDGELVALDHEGKPRFQRLQLGDPPTYFVFDLLALDGDDLRARPLTERKAKLKQLLRGAPPPLRFADHIETHGEDLFRQIVSLDLEGVMAKKAQGPYRAGRSEDWLKLCVDRRADLVVVGYSDSESQGGGLGALHLAGFDAPSEGRLVYAGRVGAAMPDALHRQLGAALMTRQVKEPACSFPATVKRPRGPLEHWVTPELVCEVRYKEFTRAGVLRQPIFQRLRVDKPLGDCALPKSS